VYALSKALKMTEESAGLWFDKAREDYGAWQFFGQVVALSCQVSLDQLALLRHLGNRFLLVDPKIDIGIPHI